MPTITLTDKQHAFLQTTLESVRDAAREMADDTTNAARSDEWSNLSRVCDACLLIVDLGAQ